MRQLLDHAAENGYGIPGFNVNNMEQIQAIMEAAEATDSPVILQGSAGARKYAGEAFLRGLFAAAVETWPSIPVAVHLDHGSSPSLCQSAIDSGFTSVMMDGSLMEDAKTPASFAYNMETTRAVVARAHAVGVSVEGELGVLGSLETGEAGDEDGVGAEGKLTRDQMLTDPDQAAEFVAATGVDALAVAIGTSHGAYKFTTRPTSEVLAIDRIKEIHAKLPNTHLVMHGSSSVPQELLAIIRAYGGQMKETYGVPVEEIQEGIRHGVRKVNIDTDIRLAMAGAMRRAMATDPSTFDPRVFLKEARLAARDLCVERYQQFGAAGQASRIVAVPLSEMAKRYARRAQLKIATARRTTDTARPANGGFEMTQEYLPNVYVEFRGSFPDVAAALDGLGEAADGAGPLDERTVRLVKLGIAIGSSSEGSVRSNARKALAAGATPEEIRHVAILAFTTCGFPTGIAGLGWIDRVLDAETRAPEASSREER